MKTRKLLAILLALVMVMGMLPAGALADEDRSDTPTSQYTIEADGITISYTASTEGSVKKIGTFEEMTMCGYSGDVYLVSLPCGTEITAIECPRSYGLTNYFGSGEMCLMYCEQNGGDALETVQEQLIYNEEFTDDQFIETHKYGYDGYGDLYSWITFDEVLPTNDVKGFAVYDADFYYWAGDSGAIVFVQISSVGGSDTPTSQYTIEADGITISYTSSTEGSLQKIGTFFDEPLGGFTGDVYLLSLANGSDIVSIECRRSGPLKSYYGSGDSSTMFVEMDSGANALETIKGQLIYDEQFTDPEFITDHTYEFDGYGDLYGTITFTGELPTVDVKGFVVYDADLMYCSDDSGVIVFIQIADTGGNESLYSIEADGITISYTSSAEGSVKKIGIFDDPIYEAAGDVHLVSLPYGAKITSIVCPYSVSGLTSMYGSGSIPVLVGINDYDDPVAAIQTQLIIDEEFTDSQFILEHSHTDISDIDQIGYGDMYSWLTLADDIPTVDVTGFAVYDQNWESTGAIVIIQISTAGGSDNPAIQYIKTEKLERVIGNCENTYYENDEDRPVVNGFKQGVLLTDYTDPTVNAYLSALSNAKAYLASLFDETGAPTAENISENQSVADGYADALFAAVLGLLSKESVGMFDVYRKYISSLNSLFNETENSGIYTEDSWNAFTSARDAANAYMAEHPFTDASTGTELTQYRALAEVYWSACYNLTPVGEAAVTLRFADNVGAKYPDRAVASNLALYSASVTLNEESGYTLEALLIKAGIAGRLVQEGGVTYLVYVNGVLLRAPFYYESDYQYSVYLFDENNTDWNDVGLRDGDDVVIVRALIPTKTVYISLEYVGFGFVSDNFGTLQSRETEITVKAGEEFSVNISGAAGYMPDYDGRYSKRTNAEIIVYGPMQEDGSYPQNCTGIVTDGSGKASLTLLETGSYYITAVDTRDIKQAPDYFYPNLMAGSVPFRVTVEPISSSELENWRNEYLTKLDTAYGGYSADYYTSDNWELLSGYYTDAKEVIEITDSLSEMDLALQSAISGMASVEQIDHEVVLNLFAHYLKYLPGIDQIENGYFTKADIERMGWIIELYGSMSDFQRSLLSSAQMTQYEALLAAYGVDGSGLPEFTPFTVTVTVDENDIVYDITSSQLWDSYYDRVGNFNQIGESLCGFDSDSLDRGVVPSITVGLGKHKSDVIYIQINISKEYYDHFDSIEVLGAEVDDVVIYEYQYYYRYQYYILNPYHDFTIHVKAVNDPLQQAKNEALSALENAFNSYSRSDYLADRWEGLTEAYIAGVQGINTADSEDAVITAKEAAIAAMAAVEKKGAGEYGSVTVIVENTTYQDAPFTGTVIPAVTVELQADSTMMGCALKALKDNGYEWGGTGGTGYNITYLSYIYKDSNGNGKWDAGEKKLGEFDGGPEAGWMGTLNDWFVNESLANFKAANGKLTDGDVIRVLYTSAGLGTDLGATWENNDTSLKSLTVTGGSFTPVFDGDVTEYILSPQGGSVTLDAVASNKNFQVRIFLNEQNKSAGAEYYRSGETIPVKSGDVIWIGVGESSWASMNEGQITGTWYSLTVMTSDDASDVEKLIRDIGSVTYDNYKDRSSAVELARAAYDALTETAKTQVSNYDVLTAAESAIAGFEDVDELKEELASLPNDMTKVSREDLEKIKDDYDYLTDAQKALLTVAEQAKVERVIAALEGIIIEETALEKLSQDVSAIEGADWSVDQATANGAAALKSYIEEKLAAMSLSGTPVVDTVSVEPAAAGDASDPDGTDGTYSFTVTLSLDGVSQSVTVNDAVIKATEYIAPVDYEPVLKAVEEYLAEKVTDPAVASVGGEWAVFALNRGGVADSSWNYKYIENLKDYVDDCGGRLHDRKYTEYSRVVLALTSMGVDPTQFATDNGTYDLVSPLLDKQNDTEYWAEWQGNNGTAFALLALDSHGYLNNDEGNAARARFIESLKEKQLEGGGWNIDSGAADLDTTAAVVYALAPYYLDATKLDELNCSVSHDELKAMVDSALEFLSGRQNTNGGYGSAEADCWTIIALSSLGRDANSDAAFVKNGHTLLSDMLSYYDEASGAFRHLMSGSVDGMATEQAAYTLVAYDRFMKGQNTLYDMSDVTFRSGLSMAEELIDSITEPVSLADEDKIEAARAAYDALSDEEKASLNPGKIIKLEAAEKALSDLKVAKAEELIDAIGSPVRLSDENAIGKARNYYNNELSDAERARVGNYDKLTSAESALQKLKGETPQGQTKAVTVTINGVTYEVSEATKKAVEAMQAITDTTDPAEKLPEDFRDLTPEKEKQILDAYSLYKALTPDEKLFATNYDDFYKNVLLKLGESYHYDERTDTDARDNDDDILPWYVKMSVEDELLTDKQKEDLASVLGEDFTERAVYRISFTDAFTGEAFEPDELISLSFPADGLDPSRTPVFVFVRDDGSFEFIDGRTVDGRLVMQATDFGTCAVTDSSYTWDEILSGGPSKPEEARSRSWALPAGIGIALLVIAGIVILIMRRRREDEE